LIPVLSVSARRLHDVNRSGWWQLLYFLPIIGLIILLFWFCSGPVDDDFIEDVIDQKMEPSENG
jgi:hypothetical protein